MYGKRMYGKKRAAVAAGAVLVLALTGCSGSGGGAAKATGAAETAVRDPAADPTGPLGRDAVQADIEAAARAAGLPGKALPKSPPTASGQQTRQQKLAARAAACTAGWQWTDAVGGALVSEPGKKYEAVLVALAKTRWADEARTEQPGPGGKGRSVRTVLTKQGWTLYATHHDLKPLSVVSLMATENACMKKFTPQEQELLSGDPLPGGATAGATG